MLSIARAVRQTWLPLLLLALVIGVVCYPPVAHAAAAGGGGIPWDTPLTTLKNDLTGPAAGASIPTFVAIVIVLALGLLMRQRP